MKVMGSVESVAVVDVICDICGKSCQTDFGPEYAELHSKWGYASSKDGEEHSCQMCEKCYALVKDYIEKLGGKVHISEYPLI